MARIGQFLGPTLTFGAPLSVVQPPDNDFAKSKYAAALLDPKLKLTQQQLDDYQQQINELFRVLQMARDLPANA